VTALARDPQLHRHGARVHSHLHHGRHRHLGRALRTSRPVAEAGTQADHARDRRHRSHGGSVEQGHSHGLIDDSTKRSSGGVRAVTQSLGVLATTAAAQAVVFVASGSVALLADLIHNFGDALTALPLAIAFILRSKVAERRAGLVVVAAIAISAGVAGVEAIRRLLTPVAPGHLVVLAIAGGVGFAGNFLAAGIRTRAGRRLASPALVADGHHARADAYVSLGVIASAAATAVGLPVADPIVGLAITAIILRIMWRSWRTLHE
jgi:divalent metal cation (Fe/Co/Zn/Cd) transporter